MIDEKNTKIAIVGLGYVGLPLAIEFGKYFETIGFDINEFRIQELLAGHDSTLEVETHELQEAKKLIYTKDTKDIQNCNIFIVTVPTPIDEHKKPDLTPLIKASISVGKVLKKDDIIWAVGNNSIANLDDFVAIIKDKNILVLRVNRNGRQLIIQMRK